MSLESHCFQRLYLCDHAGPASDNPWASFDEGPETAAPGVGALSPLYETGAQAAAATGMSDCFGVSAVHSTQGQIAEVWEATSGAVQSSDRGAHHRALAKGEGKLFQRSTSPVVLTQVQEIGRHGTSRSPARG
jgi:hypothetical protein